MTFAATANAILYENAKPVFIDVNKENWTSDVSLLKKAIIQFKPKVIITVDVYGELLFYDEIQTLASENNIFLIEDAAEALGSEYKGKKLGSGDIGILSFNGIKSSQYREEVCWFLKIKVILKKQDI